MDRLTQAKKIHTTLIVLLLTNALVGLGDIAAAIALILRESVGDLMIWIGQIIPPLKLYATHINTALMTIGVHAYTLAIFYFVSHGVIKLFLVWALLREKLWAYPLAIFFFGVFSAYQIVVLIRAPDIFDAVILILNVFVLLLVSKEYRTVRAHQFTEVK